MTHIYASGLPDIGNPMAMNDSEILDILLDDPLLKDIDTFMSEDLTDLNQMTNGFNQSYETGNNTDFWSSFLKDVANNDVQYNADIMMTDNPETDSTSHYSTSLSPQSSTSGSDNVDSSVFIDTPCMETVVNIDSCTDQFPDLHDYCNRNTLSESSIDLGADVVVITTEASLHEDSNHSIVEVPEVIVKKHPVKSVGRKKRTIEEDFSFFDSVPDQLQLTEDEKRLIKKEGLHIPTHLPLTRAEERELKRIRRKIRNKQSAQESRKRKKEYVDGLENRVKVCTTENVRLHKKVQVLENQQKTLMDQIKRLQAMIANSSTKTVQGTTCIMVLLISFALLLLPSLFPNEAQSKPMVPSKTELPELLEPAVSGPSRNGRILLSTNKSQDDSDCNDDGFPLASQEQYAFPQKTEYDSDSLDPTLDLDEVDKRPPKRFRVTQHDDLELPGYYQDHNGYALKNGSVPDEKGKNRMLQRKGNSFLSIDVQNEGKSFLKSNVLKNEGSSFLNSNALKNEGMSFLNSSVQNEGKCFLNSNVQNKGKSFLKSNVLKNKGKSFLNSSVQDEGKCFVQKEKKCFLNSNVQNEGKSFVISNVMKNEGSSFLNSNALKNEGKRFLNSSDLKKEESFPKSNFINEDSLLQEESKGLVQMEIRSLFPNAVFSNEEGGLLQKQLEANGSGSTSSEEEDALGLLNEDGFIELLGNGHVRKVSFR